MKTVNRKFGKEIGGKKQQWSRHLDANHDDGKENHPERSPDITGKGEEREEEHQGSECNGGGPGVEVEIV